MEVSFNIRPAIWRVVAVVAIGACAVISVRGAEGVIERVVPTNVVDQPEIHMFLRLPAGHSVESPTARGVLAFCSWMTSPESLRARMENDSDPLVAFARERGLALLTWNTATLWRTGKSFDQVDRDVLRQQEATFDKVARAWRSNARALIKEHGLPDAGWLLYGVSRGAHWSGRLALREPGQFLAVHIHVANSYDRPTGSAKGPVWLVSTGDLDRGCDNAKTFYQRARGLGFPIFLRVINGLGHSENPEVVAMRARFFDYVLKLRDERGQPVGDRVAAGLRSAPFLGDLLSGHVFPAADARRIPEAQRMPLPDREMAAAWGALVR